MVTILRQIFYFIAALLKLMGPGGLRPMAAEMAMLRHQLQVISKKNKRSPRLSTADRFVIAMTAFFIPARRLKRVAIIFKPATVLAFHRALVRGKYSILFGNTTRKKPGPKGPSAELISFIVALKTANPRIGYGKIALMATRALGDEVGDDMVRRILKKHYEPPLGNGPSWLTFIGHTADSLWSLDFFRCESVLLQSYWVMLVMDQYSRKIKGFAICTGAVDGPKACAMLGRAIDGLGLPKYLSTDNDPLFKYHQWGANLRILGIEEIKSVPHSPTSHPFIERLIGTVRREYLEEMLFWGEADLVLKLQQYVAFYNEERIHYAFREGRTPAEKIAGQAVPPAINLKQYAWRSHCNGMFKTPISA